MLLKTLPPVKPPLWTQNEDSVSDDKMMMVLAMMITAAASY